MTKLIHLTEEDATQLFMELKTNKEPKNIAIVREFQRAIQREFGLIWREDLNHFSRPV